MKGFAAIEASPGAGFVFGVASDGRSGRFILGKCVAAG